jgi:hypothetical protein
MGSKKKSGLARQRQKVSKQNKSGNPAAIRRVALSIHGNQLTGSAARYNAANQTLDHSQGLADQRTQAAEVRRLLIPIEGAHQNEMIAPAVTE